MLRQNVSLKDYSNYKIGGNASYFLEVKTKEELMKGISLWRQTSNGFSGSKKKIFILGNGTNILFSDNGFDGLVIKIALEGIEKIGNEVFVASGTKFSDLCDFCINNSLSGLEWAGGLPGTVGGAIRGNAGAFGGETKDIILQVLSLNSESLKLVKRQAKECKFSYRFSIFKSKGVNEVILSAVFVLKNGNKEEIQKLTNGKISYRKQKHPLAYPNIGSIFKNVAIEKFSKEKMKELFPYVKDDPFPVVPTAKLIFLAGLRGKRVGDAQISEKHTNYIVNLGNAKAKEVSELIKIIKKEIKEKFNINLEEEIMYVGGELNG